MLPSRLLLWIVMLVGAVTQSADGLLIHGFDCLNLYDGTQIQLNTHITENVHFHATSPDGRYRVGSIEYSDGSELFIETTATARRVTLHKRVASGHQIVWSPDSQLIFYIWADAQGKFHTHLATAQGEPISERLSDARPLLLSFSPDSQYFVLCEPLIGISLYSIHDSLRPLLTGPFDQWAYESHYPAGQYWSPDGKRLAYAIEYDLVIMDVETLMLQQVRLPDPLPHYTLWPFSGIQWSPDGRRILISYSQGRWGLDSSTVLYLFEVTGSAIESIPIDLPDAASPDLWSIFWVSPTELVYSQRKAPTTLAYEWEFKRYEVDTQRITVVLPSVETVDSPRDGQNVAYVYRAGTTMIVEARSADGFTPLFIHAFKAEKRPLCTWHETPYAQIMVCSFDRYEEITWIAADDPTFPLWLTTSPTLGEANNIPLGHYTDDGRFVIIGSTPGQSIKILDLKTRQTYFLPEEMIFGVQMYAAYWDTIDIFLSPDEETWLVLMNGRLFRFWLAEDRWELITISYAAHEMPIRHVLWSPDGQRYAVLTYPDDGVAYHSTLYVNEADGRFRWSMGTFDSFIDDKMRWTQCGDIFAPLRDRLAAETP